jgi:hypothetical protein
MFDQLSAEILASLIKGFPTTRTTRTTKQNVDPAVHFVYSRVKRNPEGALFALFFFCTGAGTVIPHNGKMCYKLRIKTWL